MNGLVALCELVIIFGSTFAILAIDRSRRRAQGIAAMGEPELFPLIMLAILCNVICLPYYFMKTRGGIGIVWGFLWFAAYVGLAFGVGMVVAIATH